MNHIDVTDEQKEIAKQLFKRELARLKKLHAAQVKRGAKADYTILTMTKIRVLEELRDTLSKGGLFG